MSDPVQLQVASRVRALPYDPCPADVPGTRALAARLRACAEGLDAGTRPLAGWDAVTPHDATAAGISRHLTHLAHDSRVLRRSVERAADELDAWAAGVAALQAEADGLDAAVLDNRRRSRALDPDPALLVRDPLAGLDPAVAAGKDRLEVELRRLHAQADELHARYVALARRHAARLDEAAPVEPRSSPAWRDGWDGAHDGATTAVRTGARAADWVARGQVTVATAAGVVAMAVPVTAPVAVPVAFALAGSATTTRAVLAVGAGGSWDAVGGAAVGTAMSGVGLARRVPTTVADRVTGVGVAGEVASWAEPEPVRTWDATLTTAGGTDVDVTVHDVAEPWRTGHGPVGAGFAGVATVTVPRDALRRAGTAQTGTTPTGTTPAGTTPTGTTPTGGAASSRAPGRTVRSGEGDDEHRVGGGRG